MTERRKPLTPADCDLRDFQRMMIDIPLLRQSKFDAMADDAAWRAGFNLWFSAWHSIPAGSLEEDDEDLAKAAGLGRDLRTWSKIKDKALRGFVPCTDGRLYHETVCELALESWIEKLIQRKKSGAGNATRWKIEFDPTAIEDAIDETCALLAELNPQSKYLAKLSRKQSKPDRRSIPVGGDDDPSGTGDASHRDENSIAHGSQETGTGNHSVADATGADGADDPPPDPEKVMFDAGRRLLGEAGKSKEQAGKLLGLWKGEYGAEAVIVALGKAQREGAIDPVAFIQGCLRGIRNGNGNGIGGAKSTGRHRPDPALVLFRGATEEENSLGGAAGDRGAGPPLSGVATH